MRDRKRRQRQRIRTLRRVLIVSVIAATPTLAQQPGNRILPPLPLKANGSGEVKGNPFCDSADSDVQLASGKSGGQVRLKPIGAAIGLHPIDQKKSGSSIPKLVIEPVRQPPVRNNTLVNSAHHENHNLVDTAVDSIDQSAPILKLKPTIASKPAIGSKPTIQVPNSDARSASTIRPSAQSSIILIPPTPSPQPNAKSIGSPQPLTDPVPASPDPKVARVQNGLAITGEANPQAGGPTLVNADPSQVDKSRSRSGATKTDTGKALKSDNVKTGDSDSGTDEPVFFSLSDQSTDSELGKTESDQSAGKASTVKESVPSTDADVVAKPIAVHRPKLIPRSNAIPKPIVIPELSPPPVSPSADVTTVRPKLTPIKVVPEASRPIPMISPVVISADDDFDPNQSDATSLTEPEPVPELPSASSVVKSDRSPSLQTRKAETQLPTPAPTIAAAEKIEHDSKNVARPQVAEKPVADPSTAIAAPVAVSTAKLVRQPRVPQTVESEPVFLKIADTERIADSQDSIADPLPVVTSKPPTTSRPLVNRGPVVGQPFAMEESPAANPPVEVKPFALSDSSSIKSVRTPAKLKRVRVEPELAIDSASKSNDVVSPIVKPVTIGTGKEADQEIASAKVAEVRQPSKPVASPRVPTATVSQRTERPQPNPSVKQPSRQPLATATPPKTVAKPAQSPTPAAESIDNRKQATRSMPKPHVVNAAPVISSPRSMNDPVQAAPIAAPEPTLHRKRYRPPVAVRQLPLAFERTEAVTETTTQPAVLPVKAPQLADNAKTTVPSTKLTPLYMSRTQIRSLTIGGHVRRVKVGDQSVCQAFATAPNKLKLIGTGSGVTQLVVWADTDDDQPTRMRTFEIHVNDDASAAHEAVTDSAEKLTKTIRSMFFDCDVTVRRQGEHLLVSGYCDSEDSARQIIRIVRKTCLVPVRDRLEIR